MRKNWTIGALPLAAVAAFSISWPAAAEPSSALALRTIMGDMGKEMERIAGAISREDWESVRDSALRIADHPRPPVGERARIMDFLGDEMGRFKGFDTVTHDTARKLAKAAEEGDGQTVIGHFADLQRSCLMCHTAFRQRFQEHFYGEKRR